MNTIQIIAEITIAASLLVLSIFVAIKNMPRSRMKKRIREATQIEEILDLLENINRILANKLEPFPDVETIEQNDNINNLKKRIVNLEKMAEHRAIDQSNYREYVEKEFIKFRLDIVNDRMRIDEAIGDLPENINRILANKLEPFPDVETLEQNKKIEGLDNKIGVLQQELKKQEQALSSYSYSKEIAVDKLSESIETLFGETTSIKVKIEKLHEQIISVQKKVR